MTLPISGAPTGQGISQECSNSGLQVGRGPTLPPSSWALVQCLQDSLWGHLPKGAPSSRLGRSHASPVYVGSGTFHAYPETYPSGACSYGCGGIDVGCCPLPGSICQCSTLACGQPLAPTGELLCPSSQGALSCGWSLTQDWEWDLVWQLGCGAVTAVPLWPCSNMVVHPCLHK